MKDWYSEEEIKSQLRELTDETRKLRSELDSLLRPSKTSAPRGFAHDRADPKSPPGGVGADKQPPPRKRRK